MGIWMPIKNAFKVNGPEIGIGVGLVGMWATVALSIVGTAKAVNKINRIEQEEGRELSAKEKLKEVFPYYIAPTVVGLASTTSVVLGTRGELARASALTAVAQLAATRMDATEKAMEEVVGEKKAKEIAIEANKKMAKAHGIIHDIIDTGTGDTIFCDPYFLGPLLFTGDFQTIRSRYNDIGTSMNLEGVGGGSRTARDICAQAYSFDFSVLDTDEVEFFKALDYLEYNLERTGIPIIKEDTDDKVDEYGRIIHYIRHANYPVLSRWY